MSTVGFFYFPFFFCSFVFSLFCFIVINCCYIFSGSHIPFGKCDYEITFEKLNSLKLFVPTLCAIYIFKFWAAYVPCEAQYKDAVQLTLEQIDVIIRLTDKYSKDLTLCTSAEGNLNKLPVVSLLVFAGA